MQIFRARNLDIVGATFDKPHAATRLFDSLSFIGHQTPCGKCRLKRAVQLGMLKHLGGQGMPDLAAVDRLRDETVRVSAFKGVADSY